MKKSKLESGKEESLAGEYARGFADGAALSARSQTMHSTEKNWAKAVLGFEISDEPRFVEIKQAYRDLTKILHPDQSNILNTRYFESVRKAYEILSA